MLAVLTSTITIFRVLVVIYTQQIEFHDFFSTAMQSEETSVI